jgi:hypothetical protein
MNLLSIKIILSFLGFFLTLVMQAKMLLRPAGKRTQSKTQGYPNLNMVLK